MKQVIIFDTAPGNAIGWNPNGVLTTFTISPAPGVNGDFDIFISVMAGHTTDDLPSNCDVDWGEIGLESFVVRCDHPPFNGAALSYQSVHIPTDVVI